MRALGEIGVVHQEHVARLHGLGRKVAHDRIRHRRVGAPGQLAAVAVEQADAIVVRFADHRRARGALDGVFDLRLDGIERAFDDLQHDRIDLACRQAGRGRPGLACGVHVHRTASSARRAGRTIRMPCASTSRCWPGKTTVVEPNSSTTAGPSSRKPAASDRALVDRRVPEGAVEIHRPAAALRRRGRADVELGNARPLDQPETGHAEIDQLDLLLAGVVVAESLEMGGVERSRPGRR